MTLVDDRVAALLADHPRVRDARVEAGPGGARTAVLTSRPVPAAGPDRVSGLQSMYESLYSRTDAPEDPAFDVLGWTSSYDGEPMAADAMREWVDQTVARILARRPARVLELGCGTGLLMARIAPHCDRYWATDFSVSALRRARRAVTDVAVARRIRLLHRRAEDFSGLPSDVDGVVLNSVVQYFPDLDYLREVLAGAVAATRPGGTVFVGDVRSLPLLGVFHASVVAATGRDLEPAARAAAVRRRVAIDQELVVAPAWFTALPGTLPGVAAVEIRPKVATCRNELTMFRYDVVVHVGERPDPVVVPWTDGRALTDPAALRATLEHDSPAVLAVSAIPNALVAPALADWEAIRRGTPTVPWHEGSAPADATAHRLTGLAAGLPYRLRLGLTAGRADGALDAVWVRAGGPAPEAIVMPAAVDPGPPANRGGAGLPSHDELAAFLRPWLPADLLPRSFVWTA
ncbi:hypothetical protein Q0Z83_064550 [Actinoplanes sichuanensis]|uniref:Class I SAM-dependent methyltransferase n=1 Tax=Actinoplanes sichuanensis TaxID=512349 RepID=A0ABW4ALV0_9ACTN|nr:class I SAM-dependent methyltransferase [Actinoplanes sichuanensis]BEL08264.1 hypothetical protein Q0Z83_064550 [Actinoplanes sichuanensis]